MPFKSEKQRKWMHANEPEMAKKWEKEEAIREKLRNVIRQEIKSVNEAKVLKFTDIKDRTLEKHLKVVTKKVGAELKKISGGFQVGGTDIKGLTAVVDYVFDKSIGKRLMSGGGMSKIELANESVIVEWNKYRLGGLLDSKLKKRLERTIRVIGGKVDSVGMDYITFRIGGMDLRRLPSVIKKLDRNKNVWIGDKQKNNIWDRKRNIDKLHKEAFRPKGVSLMKKIVFLPKSKLYFDPDNGNFWLMGPYGGEPDWEEDPIEPKDRDYKRTLSRLSSKDKSIMKKSLRGKGNWKEATTSVSVPGYLSPQAFQKSTQNAIDVDDEDDEVKEAYKVDFDKLLQNPKIKKLMQKLGVKKSQSQEGAIKILNYFATNPQALAAFKKLAVGESMAAPFRRRKSRGLGRPMKVGLSEGKSKPSKGDYVKTMIGVIAKIEKVRGTIAYMKLQDRKSKGYWINDLKNLKSTDKMEKGKSLWTESIDELQMAPFSSQEARAHINSDIKDMSKLLGKTSQQVIKIMMNGVRKGKYTAMDISRGIKEGPARRTHFGEMTFIQSLWTKMRDKFRRYSKDGKLS